MDEQGQRMYNKLFNIVEAGKTNMISTLQEIEQEYAIRKDFVLGNRAGMNIDAIREWELTPYPNTKGKITYEPSQHIKPVFDNHGAMNLTNHSYQQMVARLQIPNSYVENLLELGETDLLASNLNRMVERRMDTGSLIRSVGNTAKGWLSTSYKRWDATPIFEAFVAGVREVGFVPVQAYNTDYRYLLGFVLPDVFQISDREYVTYGVSMQTGDYGSAALTLGLLILRIQCTNLAVGSSILRKVHLGSRIDANDDRMLAMLSQDTINKDTKAIAGMVTDLTKASTDEIKKLDAQVKEAAMTPVDMKTELEGIKKKFGKTLAEQVKVLYESAASDDLPKGENKWRFSNVLSLLANGSGVSPDGRLDLQKEAARIIETVKAA